MDTTETITLERHASPLGEWQIGFWSPAGLSDVIESMWSFDGRVALARERIFPRGRLELIVHFDEVYRGVVQNRTEPYPLYAPTCGAPSTASLLGTEQLFVRARAVDSGERYVELSQIYG